MDPKLCSETLSGEEQEQDDGGGDAKHKNRMRAKLRFALKKHFQPC